MNEGTKGTKDKRTTDWTRRYLAGFRDAARELANPGSIEHAWLLTVGLAVDPYRVGYRAGLAAARG